LETEYTGYLDSPLGVIEIKASSAFISAINFVDENGIPSKTLPSIIIQCKIELGEYFAGKRQSFSVPVKPTGTEFQQNVWNRLQNIRYGETKSYGFIAKQMNDVNGSRAVGHANGKNPIAIVIPCHRVIGESGKLTGYAGGLWRKQWLLELEGNVSGRNPTLDWQPGSNKGMAKGN
jgi:methylated-DNA-[protein]-cysteine S-methyltransferase